LDYFPDSGFGDTWSPTVVSTNNRFAFSNNFPLELTTEDWFRVRMVYSAADLTLRTSVWRNGQPYGLPPDQTLLDVSLASFGDFRVDSIAVCSYSDDHQNPPDFAGSILAQGTLDNFEVTVPDPPVVGIVAGFSNGVWQVEFDGQVHWLYTLERSVDFQSWQAVSSASGVEPGRVKLVDSESGELPKGFYRVRAERP
jgi:hypothetical protein